MKQASERDSRSREREGETSQYNERKPVNVGDSHPEEHRERDNLKCRKKASNRGMRAQNKNFRK
jgi:hypothetical protein